MLFRSAPSATCCANPSFPKRPDGSFPRGSDRAGSGSGGVLGLGEVRRSRRGRCGRDSSRGDPVAGPPRRFVVVPGHSDRLRVLASRGAQVARRARRHRRGSSDRCFLNPQAWDFFAGGPSPERDFSTAVAGGRATRRSGRSHCAFGRVGGPSGGAPGRLLMRRNGSARRVRSRQSFGTRPAWVASVVSGPLDFRTKKGAEARWTRLHHHIRLSV